MSVDSVAKSDGTCVFRTFNDFSHWESCVRTVVLYNSKITCCLTVEFALGLTKSTRALLDAGKVTFITPTVPMWNAPE